MPAFLGGGGSDTAYLPAFSILARLSHDSSGLGRLQKCSVLSKVGRNAATDAAQVQVAYSFIKFVHHLSFLSKARLSGFQYNKNINIIFIGIISI